MMGDRMQLQKLHIPSLQSVYCFDVPSHLLQCKAQIKDTLDCVFIYIQDKDAIYAYMDKMNSLSFGEKNRIIFLYEKNQFSKKQWVRYLKSHRLSGCFEICAPMFYDINNTIQAFCISKIVL